MATNLFVSFHSLKNVFSAFLRSCSCQCCSFTHLVYAPCVPATRGMCKSVFQLFLVYASKLERHRLGKLIRSSALPVSSKTPASCWFTQENVSLRLHQVLIRRVYVLKFPGLFFLLLIYILLFTQQVVLASSSLFLYILKYVFKWGKWIIVLKINAL